MAFWYVKVKYNFLYLWNRTIKLRKRIATEKKIILKRNRISQQLQYGGKRQQKKNRIANDSKSKSQPSVDMKNRNAAIRDFRTTYLLVLSAPQHTAIQCERNTQNGRNKQRNGEKKKCENNSNSYCISMADCLANMVFVE